MDRRLRPTLTVLTAVHQFGGMAAAALQVIRPYADEIVVAFDSKMPRNQLGPLESVADVLLGFEFSGPNRFRPWLREQAHGDWLLLLDSDELPSEVFLEQLPALLANRDVSGYQLPIWWAYPTATSRLQSRPWGGGGALRLVRNDGRLWFPGTKHTGAACDPPTRFVEAPLIHLALLAEPQATREEKVARYYNHDYSLFYFDGQPINDAYYLPEKATAVSTVAIGAGDACRVEKALARKLETGEPAHDYPIASVADVEQWWVARPMADFDHQADIRAIEETTSILAGTSVQVEIALTNRGRSVWSATLFSRGGPVIHVSYHWKHPDGSIAVFEGRRTVLDSRLVPGETVQMSVDVDAPPAAGPYVLSLDLVHEGVRWFGVDRDITVRVQPGIRQQLGLQADQVVVPVNAATEARRKLFQPDGLSRSLGTTGSSETIQPPIEFAPGNWSLDSSVLSFLMAFIRREGYTRILEFGSGVSTVVVAREMASCGGSVLSIDEDAGYAEATHQLLAGSGLTAHVRTIVAGLAPTTASGFSTGCYDFSEDLRKQIHDFAPDLVLIDGPSPQGSRLAVALVVDGLVNRPTPFVMDDGLRDRELDIAARWSQAPGIEIDGIAVIGRGLLMGRLGVRSEATLNAVATNLPGAYTFFSDPRAIAVGGSALIGAVSPDGTVHAGWFRPAGCEVSVLHHRLERDDHASPAFLSRRSDGRILAFFGRHLGPFGTAGSDSTYLRVSTHPGDPTSWGPATNLAGPLRAAHFGYANPVQLREGAADPILNFFRCATDADGTCLHYSRSDDGGGTWTTAAKLARSIHPAKDSRPYFRVAQNGDDRVDICITDGHPNERTANSVYHFYYQRGHWHASTGACLGAPPFVVADHLTKVFDGATDAGKAWVWGIEIDGAGHPVIVFVAFHTFTDHRYRYARWDGTAWRHHEIAAAGSSIYRDEAYYSGGICLDPENVNVVYFSRAVDDVFQLFRAMTPDDGATWIETQITNGATHCMRPYVVRGLRQLCYITGRYDSYTRFETEVALLDIAVWDDRSTGAELDRAERSEGPTRNEPRRVRLMPADA